MKTEQDLLFSLEHKEYWNAARVMLCWYSSYVEGFIDRGAVLYNKYLPTVPIVVLEHLLELNPGFNFSKLEEAIKLRKEYEMI